MKKIVSRFWLMLIGALLVSLALNPIGVITFFCLPLVSLGILGCPTPHSPKYKVSPSPDGQPTFHFDDYTWNSQYQSVFPLTVTDSSAKHEDRNVWSIKCDDQKKFRLQTLEYGTVPPGWTEVFPPKPLVTGDYYRINHGDYFTKSAAGKYEHLSSDDYFYKAQHNPLHKDFSKEFKFP